MAAKRVTKSDLEKQLAELTEALQRERADAENVRKQAEASRAAAIATGKEMAVESMLDLIDNLARAFSHAPEEIADNPWVKGVMSLEKQLQSNIKNFGLEKISTIGEEFDADTMEAVQVEDGDGDKQVVIDELKSGYRLNGRVIRHAMVRLGQQ